VASSRELAFVIDHTVLRPSATERDVLSACDQATEYGFASLVVAPFYLPLIVPRLERSSVKPCTVVSFPFGAHMPLGKVDEARRYVGAGAGEIDVVMNIGAFLSGQRNVVEEEIKGLAEVCRGRAMFKLIIETAYLNAEQIAQATELAIEFGADFVKTSTGYAERGVTLEDIRTIKAVAGDRIGIKASGGIRTADFARELLDAGATRLGCSASVQIVRG
jgi:deoxyribose-phosphate aldolase